MEISNSPLQIDRNWLDLPQDVTLRIMKKLRVTEILESTQFVCKMWYILCKEPSIWRTLRIHDLEKNAVMKMMFSAVDRSNGGLIELDIEGFCSNELFSYAISRQLKRLRLARCYGFSAKTVKEALEKLLSLEELELTLYNSSIFYIISSCSSLTTFKFNKRGSPNPYHASDDEALTIAAGMPKLRHLQLIGNNMTNVGLTAILDGCPLLQSLDLRACFQLDLAGNLGKRLLEKIKDLRLPNDSTEDYNYDTIEYDYDDYGDDIHSFLDLVADENDYDISKDGDFY